jgi:hypothetical protein
MRQDDFGDKLAMIRAAAKLPDMTDEQVRFHMREIGKRIARQRTINSLKLVVE